MTTAKSAAAFLICCLLLVACRTHSFAQAKFSASAAQTVPVNQNLQVNFTLEGANASQLKPPTFEGFQVLSGPNQSSSMQWVNGVTTQSITFSYIIKPKAQGTFKIGKAAAKVDNVWMEANELTVQVTAPVQQQAQQRRRDPFSDPFFDDPFWQSQQQQPEVSQADVDKQLKENVFLKLVTSKSSVYEGEQLTASLKLYYRLNFGKTQLSKAPTFDGFWNQEIELPQQKKPGVETINGQQFYVIDVQQFNLFPQKSGALKITPAELKMVVQAQVKSNRRRSVWDDFFGGGMQNFEFTAVSNGATVNVKELPAAGKPADYNGAVGKLNFETSLSAKEAKTDEAITYTLKISGTGNLKLIEAPTLSLPPNFEVYDPKMKEDVSNSAGGMSGTKRYDYLIIPRQPGEYKIPGNAFSYFDPASAKYITINSPEYSLKVTGAASQNPNTNLPTVAANKDEVKALGKDIRYIKTSSSESGNSFFGSAGFVALYASPFLLFAALLAIRRRSDAMAADVMGTKRKRATKLAKKRLSAAEKHLAKGDKKLFYDEVSRALWGYLGDKLSIDTAELSKDNVEEQLQAGGAKNESIVKLKALLNTCDLALYSPVGEGSEMNVNYENAVSLIADLEDELQQGSKARMLGTGPYSTLLLCVFCALCANAKSDLFSEANALYKQKQFAQAAEKYEAFAKSNPNTEVFYNLGNCYYKTEETGKAILNYERALKLSPNDEDVQHNLALANMKCADKIVPVEKLFAVKWWNSLLNANSSRGWSWLAVVFAWLAFTGFAVYMFLLSLRKAGFYFGSLFLLLSLAFLFLGFKQHSSETNSCSGILLSASAYIKSAPDAGSTDLFILHEGAKLELRDEVGEWAKIRLADGKQGWLPRAAFQKI